MNARNLIATGALLLSTAIAAPAMAILSTGNLGIDIQSAVGSGGNVSVQIEDGVATVWGNVKDAGTKQRVLQAAFSHRDVERVIDLVTY